jgi:microsomal dipeptidase-like Zn-dependent dipeptidase
MRLFIKVVLSIAGLGVVALIGAFVFGPGYLESTTNIVTEHTDYEISGEAKGLHDTLIIGDLHSDTLLWKRNILKRADRGHVDIPRLREGNVALTVFPTVTKVPKGLNYDANTGEDDQIELLALIQRWPLATRNSLTARALYQASKLQDAATSAPEELKVILSQADLSEILLKRANGQEIIGGLLSFEGAHALDGDLENIHVLFDAGFRLMELHHFFDNELGGSLHGLSKAGLTDFGRAAVEKMSEQGIIIDVAHSSESVVDEVLAMVDRPLIVSHTGVKGACDSARNISDDHMKRIAGVGGLIGIGYWSGAVCDASPAGVVTSLRYAIDLVGVEHVALGSDYDGGTSVLFDTSEIAILTQTMMQASFSEAEIRAVMGENMVRFLSKNLPKG